MRLFSLLFFSFALTAAAQVEPLLSTTWAQGDPYNMACPSYERTNSVTGTKTTRHYAVGCVPLALGQIMNFHQWPRTGEGSIRRKTWLDRDSLIADFGATTYDWASMRTNYPSAAIYSPTDPSVQAVSTLLFHVGLAMGTIYQTSGSSTISSSALAKSLATYFGYDADSLRFVKRADYGKEEWMELIKTELAKGRPIYYSGNSAKQGAHAWVIDGHDGAGLVHINWGWGGFRNGYFDVDLSLDDAETDFVTNHAMLLGMVPRKASSTVSGISTLPAGDDTDIVAIYTLNGQRVSDLQPGVNIVRWKNGKTTKVRF